MNVKFNLTELNPPPEDLPDEVNAKTFLYILEKLKLLGINATYTYNWGIYDPELDKVAPFHMITIAVFTKERFDEFTIYFRGGKCELNYSPDEAEDTEYFGVLTLVETITQFTNILEKIFNEVAVEIDKKIDTLNKAREALERLQKEQDYFNG